jgi:hypothetical protein
MWMNRVISTEGGKELSSFHLKIEGQVCRLQECFFDFDLGLIVVIQFENNIRETLEVRVNRAVESELDIACVVSAMLRIVVANFVAIEIARARVGLRKQSLE